MSRYSKTWAKWYEPSLSQTKIAQVCRHVNSLGSVTGDRTHKATLIVCALPCDRMRTYLVYHPKRGSGLFTYTDRISPLARSFYH